MFTVRPFYFRHFYPHCLQANLMSQIISPKTQVCLSKFKPQRKLFTSVEGQKLQCENNPVYTIRIYN